MTKPLRRDLGLYALGEHERGAGVPQSVRGEPRKAGLRGQPGEHLRQRLRVVGPTHGACEYVITLEILDRGELLLGLQSTLSFQHLDETVVEFDRTRRVAALARRRDDLVAERRGELDDLGPVTLEIDVRPAQRDELADAQPASEQERPHGPLAVVGVKIEELARLLRGPVLGDASALRRPRCRAERAHGDDAEIDGHLERARERCSGQADRVRRQRSSVLGAALLRQLPLPGDQHHGRDVADLVPAEVGADVELGVLAVIETGLDGQLGVGIDAVEVLVEQLVDREARRGRRRPAGVRQAEQLAASAGRCRRMTRTYSRSEELESPTF